MGYDIDKEIGLWVPDSVWDAALAVAERINLQESGYAALPGDDPQRRFLDLLVQLTGADGDGDVTEHEVAGVTGNSVSAQVWGKCYDSADTLTAALAAVGVIGIVDCRGEDGALWRERLHGGEVHVYRGEIEYPDDPLKDDPFGTGTQERESA